VIPVICIKKRKIVDRNSNPLKIFPPDIGEVVKFLGKEYEGVYIVDMDGLERNRADFDLYKKLGTNPLWIDSSPRDVGDVVDLFVAGANKITIRLEKMDFDTLKEVRWMCDGPIFLKGSESASIAREIGFDGIVIDENANEASMGVSTWVFIPNQIQRLKEMGVQMMLRKLNK
jgi:hypothetical protein